MIGLCVVCSMCIGLSEHLISIRKNADNYSCLSLLTQSYPGCQSQLGKGRNVDLIGYGVDTSGYKFVLACRYEQLSLFLLSSIVLCLNIKCLN